MRGFIDECISPSLARHLNESGLHDAVHPRDRGRPGEPNHVVFQRAIAEDRIIVTENEEDFRRLAAGSELHPGFIILPSVARLEAQRLMELGIAWLLARGGGPPENILVNSVLIVTSAAQVRIERFR